MMQNQKNFSESYFFSFFSMILSKALEIAYSSRYRKLLHNDYTLTITPRMLGNSLTSFITLITSS